MLVNFQDTHAYTCCLFVWSHLVAKLLLGHLGGVILALESHPVLELDVRRRLCGHTLAALTRETFAVVNRPVSLSLGLASLNGDKTCAQHQSGNKTTRGETRQTQEASYGTDS